ncbi:MAG TPA: type VI secretion system membrane subunit TssM [Pyrinomonadaceae bacterium]|nr:type VI secretion system membrane subunit TssM [Pyrinomonadaceae bacterium]
MVVWVAGTKMNYPVNSRIVIIALILLTLPIALLIGYVASRRKAKKEEAKLNEAAGANASQKTETVAAKPQKLAAPTGNYDDLTKSAEEVAQFLKSSNLDVYSLPWYLVTGTPKAGKSSLVLGSNLNFQNLPSQRQSEQKFVRPTRNVDWRVTSEAVFVDTAGRYQTEGADGEEWAALLETIKKYRGARPLDGMILSVSAERVLHADEKEVEEQAKVLRARIDEAMQRTKVRFPIYLVFTHADAIEGFRDSFSNSQKEGQNLVWGATIPLENADHAHSLFDSEYELLQTAVLKRRLIRLSAPFPPVRQLRIFNFPLHFGSARRKLGAFVSTLFRPNPFSESPFLRGFYFTAVPVNRPKLPAAGQTLAGIPQTIGQTYFTEKLFREVVLRDKDLVATLQAQRQKPPILGWLATITGAFLVALLLGLSAFSLYQNKKLLDEAAENGEKVLTLYKADAGRDPFTKTPDEALVELNAIENLRENLVELDEYERRGAPLLMRMGLYSGDRIYRERLLKIYFNAVEQRFKAPVVKRLEEDLRKFSESPNAANTAALTEPEEELLGKNYDLLKAYLMLSGEPQYRGHAEATTIVNTLSDYWNTESKLGSGLELASRQQLEFWAKQVDRDEFPFIKLKDNIVTGARKKLLAFPAWQRYYKRKTTDISRELNAKNGDLTVANILAKEGADASFIEGGYRVPNAFTIEGLEMMDAAVKNAEQELSADDWVMGDQSAKTATEGTEAAKIQDRYYRDYTDEWRKFVKGVSVKNYANQTEADNALEKFASANSPVTVLMREIMRQTNLSGKPKPAGWWDWLASLFQSRKKVETGGNTPVERDFRPLFAFVGTDEKPESSQLNKYGLQIQAVYSNFHALSPEDFSQVTKDIAQQKDLKLEPKLRDAEKAISGMTGSFNETPAGQELANILKKPLTNLRNLLGVGVTNQLDKAWAEQILPKAKEIEKGYPFEDAAGEADITKLTAYLNPADGSFSKFFEDRLAKYFEESNGQWKPKATSEVKFSDEFVAYLNNAFRLREALFGKSKTPSFNYEFRLQKAGDALIEVTIDGQKIDSNGTGSTNFKFPAPSGDTGAFMKFASTSESTPTSGATPATAANTSANTSPGNVSNSGNSNTTSRFWQSSNANSSGGASSIERPGTWGLFRFFEAGKPEKQSSGEYKLTYTLGGKTVTATVKPTGGDLFDRNMFKSVRAPQNLLK